MLPPEIRLIGAFALFLVLPGYLFMAAAFGRGGQASARWALERWLLALGCGYVLAELLAFVLYALYRPLSTGQVLVGAAVLNSVLLIVLTRPWMWSGRRVGRATLTPPRCAGPSPAEQERGSLTPPLLLRGRGTGAQRQGEGSPSSIVAALAPALLILIAAAPLRLWNLGYSELQGDEAKVVLRAMAVLQGVPDALIAHRKPPGEVLIGALFGGGLGVFTELAGRLPFALAGLAAVLAGYALGRAMFGWRAGLVAALLMAVNGYWVAFGRMLQYQSLGLLLDTLAVLCLYRFARTAERGYAVVGALLLAGAGLTALSAVFLLPVAAVALWPASRQYAVDSRQPTPTTAYCLLPTAYWLWPLAPLAVLALATYGPLARGAGDTLDPSAAWPYLAPRLGDGQPYFNLDRFLTSVNHYTSSLYTLVVLGLGGALLATWAFVNNRIEGAGDAGTRGRADAETARAPLATIMAFTWLVGPLVTHLFLIRIPGTHWREIFPGLVLLVGAATVGLYDRWFRREASPSPRLRLPASPRLALAAGLLFLAACAHFVYVAWVRPWPEYQLNYPLYRHPLDWSGRTSRDPGGTFGDARHFGWKTIAVLVAEGRLPSDYATNDPRQAEAAWYLKAAQGCPETAALYVRLPLNPRERRAIERSEPLPDWAPAGRVLTDARATLAFYLRLPPPAGPLAYDDSEYAHRFDRDLASPWTPVGQLYRPEVDFRREC